MASGLLVGGRYRLEEVLGAGGMGVVWRAYDERLHRAVAVKEIRYPSVVTAEERADLTQRAMIEARSAARLDHPGIVAVHDVVEEDDRPWIVMRLVAGRSLDQVVRADGPLDIATTAKLGLALVDALTHAHAARVVHRDVKPSNVLVQPDGRVLLTDFSIALVLGVGTVTKTGVLLGSPGYIAPERMLGGVTGPAADLFGLGATLYFAVEGRGPFDAAEPLAGLFATANQPHPHDGRRAHSLRTPDDPDRSTAGIRHARDDRGRIAGRGRDRHGCAGGHVGSDGNGSRQRADCARHSRRDDGRGSDAAGATMVGLGTTAPLSRPAKPDRRRRRAAVVAAVAVLVVLIAATALGDFLTKDTDGSNSLGPGPIPSGIETLPSASPTSQASPGPSAVLSPAAVVSASPSPKPARTSPTPRRTTKSPSPKPKPKAITANFAVADSYLTANCDSSVTSVTTTMTATITVVNYPVTVEYWVVGNRYGPWRNTITMTSRTKTIVYHPTFDPQFEYTYHFYLEVLSPMSAKSATVPLQIEFCPS